LRSPDKRFGAVLRELRRGRGLSQEELAFESNLNRQFISLLELGRRSPSLQTVYKVAAGLGMSGSELLGAMESHSRTGGRKRSRR
jgi:transcriptional regulator with XRE-family HTH domain